MGDGCIGEGYVNGPSTSDTCRTCKGNSVVRSGANEPVHSGVVLVSRPWPDVDDSFVLGRESDAAGAGERNVMTFAADDRLRW